MPERHTGTVAKWLNHKGIGFITPDGAEGKEGEDILVHFQQIKQETEDGFKSLEQGSKVEYTLEQDPKDATKSVAVNVTGPEGADCPPKTKGSKGGKGSGKRSSKGKGKGKKGSKGKGKGKKKEDGEEEAEE